MNHSGNVSVNHPNLAPRPSAPRAFSSDTDWLAQPFPKVIHDLLAVQEQQQALNVQDDESDSGNEGWEKRLG